MPQELPKAYEPQEVEKRWSEFWIRRGLFHAEAASKKPPFCMVIPPPNVTGILHMGHALNNTLQDILARYKRMRGFNVLWLPGTDHAGIATQNVVERELAKEGKNRQEVGRERFIKRIWEWKGRHGDHILRQLKRLGASCDWSRERFTMDEGLSQAVREAFVRLYEEGLIYRDLYLINWCPRCRTALSDLEVEHVEQEGSLWFVRYGPITVATTRPETMLGDTAVAVNPEDKRYQKLVGQKVMLPLVNREIPIIVDARVDPAFGTGAVKVTPAHDFNDFVIGNDHQLPRVAIFTEEARMNENAIHFAGLDRFECRTRIVKELDEKGFLERVEPHRFAVGHCQRCHTIVEPTLSLQWFVRTKPLAERALGAVRQGKTKFFPSHWTKTYEQWIENVKDWCISRQIWWGHRIPAWYCRKSSSASLPSCPPIVSRETPKKCPTCGSAALQQDPDVLDTWFSSALWPFSTLGWPEDAPLLRTFYPTSVLVTGFDIIFFWVARMMMMGLKFMGEVPFRDVYIHALVRDAEGKKMSKSKGNVVDPLEIMDRFGTDAFRFTLAILAVPGRDVRLSEPVIEGYRNFCNKIWNSARFFLAYPYEETSLEVLSPFDQWILAEWSGALQRVTQEIEEYRFDEAAKALYQFFWHDFCDWYLEFTKARPNLTLFREIFAEALRALHPFMPFITDELWSILRTAQDPESLIDTPFPVAKPWPYEKEVAQVLRVIDVVTALRTIRGENGIPATTSLEPIFWIHDESERSWFEQQGEIILRLTRSKALRISDEAVLAKGTAHYPLGGIDIYVPLEGLVDLEVEKRRLQKEIQKLKQDQQRLNKKLDDQGFLEHAGREVVEQERKKFKVSQEKLARLEETYGNL